MSPSLGELRAHAIENMRPRVGPGGSARTDGNIEPIVAFIDAFAWSEASGGMFNAKEHALWRLLQTMVPSEKDSGWDDVRKRVTATLEGAGCWERIGGDRGPQWWLRRRWGSEVSETSPQRPLTCRRQDNDGLRLNGMDGPRFCLECSHR